MATPRGARLERHLPFTPCSTTTLRDRHAADVASQTGEDGVLEAIFDAIVESPRRPTCVEIGAWDGKHLSNTWNLIVNKSWSGMLVEADPARVTDMEARYATRPDVQCVCALVGFDEATEEGGGKGEGKGGNGSRKKGSKRARPSQAKPIAAPARSLAALLESAATPLEHDFELLSIDIDGADYHLWESLRETPWRPQVVVIEFNPTIPNHINFVQERSTDVHHGTSLRAMVELGRTMGYELAATTLFNGIFLRSEIYERASGPDKLAIGDNSVDAMHSPSMTTDLFQLYDGTLVVAGCKKLLWQKVPINNEDIQVLPKHQRRFGFEPPTEDEVVQLGERLDALRELPRPRPPVQTAGSEGGGGDGSEVSGRSSDGGDGDGRGDCLDEWADLVDGCMRLMASPSQQAKCLQLAFDAIAEASVTGRAGTSEDNGGESGGEGSRGDHGLAIYLLKRCVAALETRAEAVLKAFGSLEAARLYEHALFLLPAFEDTSASVSAHLAAEQVRLATQIGRLYGQHGDVPRGRYFLAQATAAADSALGAYQQPATGGKVGGSTGVASEVVADVAGSLAALRVKAAKSLVTLNAKHATATTVGASKRRLAQAMAITSKLGTGRLSGGSGAAVAHDTGDDSGTGGGAESALAVGLAVGAASAGAVAWLLAKRHFAKAPRS